MLMKTFSDVFVNALYKVPIRSKGNNFSTYNDCY